MWDSRTKYMVCLEIGMWDSRTKYMVMSGDRNVGQQN
jgi:hypothetical protein